MAKSLREVQEQMAAVDIDVPSGCELIVNGSNWKRFKPANSHFKRGKEAWYAIWECSLGSGRNYYFGVFGIGSQSYKIEHSKSGWTRDEWQQIQARRNQDQKIVDEAIEERRKNASEKAAKMLQAARPSVSADHPYAVAKRIRPVGASQLRDQILIPMTRNGHLTGLQTIFPSETSDGSSGIQKRFLTGSDLKGSYALLGNLDNTQVIFITEGWATGCSIFEAVEVPVVVAFSAGNLLPVAEIICSQYPHVKICIAADNDCHYHTKLKEEFKERFGIELEIHASGAAREQEYPGGKVRAYWRTKDKETYLEVDEWVDGRAREYVSNFVSCPI